MKQKIFGFILFLLGLFVVLSPRYILPVCEFTGKHRMACTYTANAELFMGFLMLSIAAGVFFSVSADALRWLMFVALAAGVSVILIPEVLGYCPSPQMPCRYGAVPMLRLLGGLTVILSSVGFITSKGR
ncbi:MAG: DUF4418 family protein [Thermodesulfovibrionales bacterium]|nr:DUF4418 family protein [Thermodesulfovibrionales bacterium]